MANQSTQRYIDGEKDWITAMLASAPIVEGKSPEQVEKLLIQEIKEPEVDIDPIVEKEIAELQEKKLNEEKKELVQESLEVAKFDVNELTDFFTSVTQAKKQLKSKVKEEKVRIDKLEQLFDTLSANKKKKVVKKRPKKLLLEPEEIEKVKETVEDPGVPQSVKEEALKQLDEKEENKYIKAVEKQLTETRYQSELDKDRIKTLDRIDSFDKMKKEFANFKDKVQIQLASLGGGGSVKILDNDDVDVSSKANGKILAYNSTTGKMEFTTNAGGTDLSAVDEHILPDADGTRNLGSASKRWKEIFLSAETVNLGGSTISSDGTGTIAIAATGATLPENSKDAGGNPIAVTGTGAGTGGVTISKVPFFTRSGGLSTKNTDFEFNATVDNNKPFLDQSTFVLANGSGLTSDDTITIFQL